MSQSNKNNEIITLSTIAKQVGVSVSTVSRVLNGKAKQFRIPTETEEAIRKVAADLSYLPNHLALSLRTKKTHTIGIAIPDISNPFFSAMVRNIEIESKKYNYAILLCDTQENTELEIESINILMKQKVDGLIISPVGIKYEHLKKILQKGTPIVVIDRYSPDLDCPSVVSDNYQGAFEAVNYFIDHGHQKIACIQGLINTSVNNDRVKGYQDALKSNNISVNKKYVIGDSFGIENGYISTKLLLSMDEKPTAIIALSNLICLGVLRALYEEKLNVPNDVSIISFDDQVYTDYLATPVTTIAQMQKEMGRIACRLLISQIEFDNNIPNKKIILPTKLIIRNSVKKL